MMHASQETTPYSSRGKRPPEPDSRRRALEETPTESVRTDASSDSPATRYDFVAFLSERLGVSDAEAKSLLRHWLLTYEPERPRPVRFLCRGTTPEARPALAPSG